MIVVGLGLLAVCGDGRSGAASPVGGSQRAALAPTRTLVPVTATPSPEPTPALSPTPTELPAPGDLLPPATPDDVPFLLPALQQFLDRARDDVRAVSEGDTVRLLSIERFIWRDAGLGCATHPDSAQSIPATRGYRILLLADSTVYAFHTDDQDRLLWCEDAAWWERSGKPLPPDPIAQEIVLLTTRDAADRLDVPVSEITLVSLLNVPWPDASVGCPQPDADYDDQPTLGYRIVFQDADDQSITYHTSIRHFLPCAPEDEVLPGFLRRR